MKEHQTMNKTRNMPEFCEIAGKYRRTNTKRAYIHKAGDYKLIEVRSDFAVLCKDATIKDTLPIMGLAWFLGENNEMPDFNKTEQSFYEGFLPIHICSYEKDFIEYEQTAFTANINGVPVIALKLRIFNSHPASQNKAIVTFSAVNCEFAELYNEGDEDYIPFVSLPDRWLKGEDFQFRNNSLFCGDNVAAHFVSRINPVILSNNLVRFEKLLGLNEETEIIVYMPYEWAPYRTVEEVKISTRKNNFIEKVETFKGLEFDNLLEETAGYWRSLQKRATQISVPEYPVDRIYKTLTLNSLQLIAFPPESPFAICGQGGKSDMSILYAWESKYLLNALDILGFGEYTRPVIDYYLSIQSQDGPEGKITSKQGAFRPYIWWMVETGAVMRTIAYHYYSSKDKDWLSKIEKNVVDACEWVYIERNATKVLDVNGLKVKHYGLLPEGRVHDWPDYGNFYFSDAYTWEAYMLCAKALEEIGSANSEKYLLDSKDYLSCIREAYSKSTYPLPGDKSLTYYSNQVYGKPDHLMSSYGLDGPTCMMETGVIDSNDVLIKSFYASLKALKYIEDIFTCRLNGSEGDFYEGIYEKAGGSNNRRFYTNTSETVWNRVFLRNGDLHDALRMFYSVLAFSTSKDLGIVSERFSPEMEWFIPWQPNGSGNGRILQMINSMLFYEDDDRILHLLKGVPSHWLKPGDVIRVDSGRVLSAEIDLLVVCSVDGNEIRIDLNLKNNSLKGLCISMNRTDAFLSNHKGVKSIQNNGTEFEFNDLNDSMHFTFKNKK
jgi:hypothetical protein